ncbi:MAG TPA: hypothetical protein VM261_01020 [Kofleriaceae bacterium]|nr:hypothetical protein [Kofleriaceae bacterium]
MGHRRRLSCVCAVALVAACGDNLETRTASGSRLRLSWLEYEDGTRHVIENDLWDDARGEECRPQRWNDGVTYCSPSDRVGLYPYYTDAACTNAEYLAEVATEPAYVARFADVTEGEQSLLARPVPATLDQFWIVDGELCSGPYAGAGHTFFGPGAEVSRSALARLRTVESTGEGRVRVVAAASDDGLYMPLDFVDRNLHDPCVLGPLTATSAVCLPRLSGEVQYRDAGCREPVLVARDLDGDGSVDVPGAVLDGTSCAPRVYSVGVETADGAAFRRDGETCAPSMDVGLTWFELHEHPAAEVSRARVPAPGRRLEPIYMNVDGVQVMARQLYDTEVGEECIRATSSREPDASRCVPRDAGVIVDAFGDAACTIPIEVAVASASGSRGVCDATTAPRFARDFSGATIMRSVGALRTAPIYDRVGGVCQLEADSRFVFHDLGDAIPDTRWARATRVRD